MREVNNQARNQDKNMSAAREIGQVVMYSDFRGYGFIRTGKGRNAKDYFVHASSIHSAGHRTLDVGQTVEFTPRVAQRGIQAIDVRVISSEKIAKAAVEPSWVFMKKNPFTPQDPITDPNKFAGRRQPFHNAVDAIYNNKNILITGHRGIGKSSIAYQLLYLAAGENSLATRLGIDLGGETFDHICGDYRCLPGNSLGDIANGLLTTLAQDTGRERKELKDSKKTVDIDLKFFKTGLSNTYQTLNPSDLSIQFSGEVNRIYRSADHKARGVTFLIDEVDVLLGDVHLAPFLKACVEKMRLNHHLDISFVVSGVTGTTTDLLVQHPSSARLFENLVLDRMDPEELGEIIDLSLADTGVSITQHAKNRIVSLSNNFPQPVHLLGYHAFRLDAEASIDVHDVEKARDFVVQHLKKQDFNSRFEGLKEGSMLNVVRAFAFSKYETVNFAYISNQVKHLGERELFGIIGQLEKGIIEKQSKGNYRFCDPLFKVYLRWVFGMDEHN